jgi:haloacetate dehalogenase
MVSRKSGLISASRRCSSAIGARGRRCCCCTGIHALLLWSLRDDLEQLYGDPRVIWRDWADDLRGHGIDSGHHMAEEAPDALGSALAEFFAG